MKVLFSHDGAVASVAAGDLIKRFLHRERSEITVVSVVEKGFPHANEVIYRIDPVRSRAENAKMIVEHALGQMTEAGFTTDGRVLEGDPAREILKVASDEGFGLVVMGGGHRSWAAGVLLGSVTNRVLHTAECSLLIAHETGRGDLQRVVLGVDGSEGSSRAVEVLSEAIDEARCDVTVASIVPDPPPPIALPGLGPVSGDTEEDFEGSLEAAREIARKTSEGLKSRGFKVHTEVRVGSPSSVLLEEGEDAGLIAIGAHGLGSFRRAIVGSVSEAVVRHSRAALIAR